ncbi:MAG: glycosyltransferase [Burkholderiaceae bacterium]|nr:glycosyltransferase [Burkholderiaceae bacterium]
MNTNPAISKPGEWRRIYLPVRAKFGFAIIIATLWTALSVWLSWRWLHDLATVATWAVALIAITFIAYVPGFMNAFLVATLLFDRRPPLRQTISEFPSISILVAAYNEAETIKDTLTSLARQDYAGPYEVLILNDGSVDQTAAVVREVLKTLYFPPNATFRQIDFEHNRGKSAVLKDGLNAASHPFIMTVDSDCWVRSDGLTNIVSRMLSDPSNTVAVAGAVMARNSRANLLTRTQEWDYFHGIAAVKRMQSMYHGTLVAQGAFSLYTRKALEEVGGWPTCVGEDIVVSWALLERGYRIGYAANAFAFTNVPDKLGQFARQRKRWSRGLMEAFKAHWRLLFKPRMTTLFIWWNFCFPPIDFTYTVFFIPGLILALLGYFWIAGPVTLAVFPLAVLWNTIVFRIQKDEFQQRQLKVRRNHRGFLIYAFFYSLLMQPICVWGYFAEIVGMRKRWGTK